MAEVIRGRVRAQALDALYRNNPTEVPQALVEEQVQQLQIETARRLGIRDASQLPRPEAFLEAALDSRHRGHIWLETPHLAVRYRSYESVPWRPRGPRPLVPLD